MHPDILADQLGLSAVIVCLIQWLKGRTWLPWVGKGASVVNRSLALLAAAATTAGIHFTWNMDAAGTLTVAGLTGGNMVHFTWETLKQVAYQEGIFRSTVRGRQE